MPVLVGVSRRIHRRLDPPLDHLAVRTRLERVAGPLLGPGRTGTLGLMLCSDRVIRRLNAEWLDRDSATNVIAFPSPALGSFTARAGALVGRPGVLSELAPSGGPVLHVGDIAVSVDTARREQGHAADDERVVYLAMHGLLHILGWDHDTEARWRRMHRAALRLMRTSR